MICICSYDLGNTIGCNRDLVLTFSCLSCNENRDDCHSLATPVKILQVECIVDRLFDGIPIVIRCTHFEFNYEHGIAYEQHIVGTFSHPGDEILEKNRSAAQAKY